jgi:hypothetical protein
LLPFPEFVTHNLQFEISFSIMKMKAKDKEVHHEKTVFLNVTVAAAGRFFRLPGRIAGPDECRRGLY